MRPPGLTIRSAKTVKDEACPAIWLADVPFSRAEVRLAMACWDSRSPSGRENTRDRASSFPPSLPRRVNGGLLMTKLALGSCTMLPVPVVAPTCSSVAEKKDWISDDSSQSREPR